MLLPTITEDVTTLVELARETGVFYDHEIDTLREVFDDYYREACDDYGHLCFTARRDGRIIGFVYLAPVEMTDRTWEMWWIAVSKELQGKGVGGEILRASEAELAEVGCRVLLIETSALPRYEPTCKFYRKHGYREVARIPDYYRDGDDKLIYSKRIVPESRTV